MIDNETIISAIDRISLSFYNQCKFHRKEVKGTYVYACGQHLNVEHNQRGIHGVSAAINVLSLSLVQYDNKQEIINGLVQYITDPFEMEQLYSFNVDDNRKYSIQSALNNIIKISEIIIALSYIPEKYDGIEQVIKKYVTILKEAKIHTNGWGFFTNNNYGSDQLHVIPTAFATLALCRVGELEIEQPLGYLRDSVSKVSSRSGGGYCSDTSTRVLAMFALTEIAHRDDRFEYLKDDLKKNFKHIWRQLESLLDDDTEQNIEYHAKERSHYVRIPWQFYLLSVAADLYPMQKFGNSSTQRKLKTIIKNTIKNNGFVYPISGDFVSSRTNSILLRLLEKIRRKVRLDSSLIKVLYVFDKTRNYLGSNFFLVSARLIALIFFIVALYNWWYFEDNRLFDIGSNLIAGLLITILTFAKREK